MLRSISLSRSTLNKLPQAALLSLVLGPLVVAANVSAAQTAAPPAAAAGKADDTYLMKRTYKSGDVDHYKIKMNTKMTGPSTGNMPAEFAMEMLFKETVNSISEDGVVTSTDEYDKADGVFNGQQVDMTPMMPKLIIKRDKKGKVDVITDGGNEQINAQIKSMTKQMYQSQTAYMPAKPIKVGDSWQPEPILTIGENGAITKMTITLVSVDTVDGVKLMKLKTVGDTTSPNDASSKIHTEGTTLLDAATCKLVKMTSKASGTAAGGTVNVEMTFETAKPADLKAPAKEAGPK